MSITNNRATAASQATLRTRIRKTVGDRETNTANQRWSDNDIDTAIADQLMEMYAELSQDPGTYLLSVNMSYPEDRDSVVLPPDAQAAPIYQVVDITESEYPRTLTRVASHNNDSTGDDPVWFRSDISISVRPNASARRLKVYYIGNPFVFTGSNTADQHPYPVAHEELIVLGAAIRLQEEDEEIPENRQARYDRLWAQFQNAAMLYRGPRALKSNRRIR